MPQSASRNRLGKRGRPNDASPKELNVVNQKRLLLPLSPLPHTGVSKQKQGRKGMLPFLYSEAPNVKRIATAIRGMFVALIVVSVAWIVHRFPVGPVVQKLEDWSEELGIWSPLMFGLVYVAAVVALIPGSALTLAAGALFGLVGGTIVASLASTTGAALAFLISRYLARASIRARLLRYPKFDAIDKAVSESGWRIVALLRLSPAIPFNVQNYLYGLTGIRFWPYVLTSWLAMLPATFLYVYLGDVGREGLQAAAGSAKRSTSAAEWVMPIVGLLATVAVTVYLSRLARKAMRQVSSFSRHTD